MSYKEKLILSTQDWHYTCGDGCCDEYGEKIFINGQEIDADLMDDTKDVIEKVLKQLGYEVEWEELDYDRTDLSVYRDDFDD